MSAQLILASSSASRRRLLESAGIRAKIVVSHVDEPQSLRMQAASMGLSVEDLSIEQRVLTLAWAKAHKVYEDRLALSQTLSRARGECITAYPLEAVAQSPASSACASPSETSVSTLVSPLRDVAEGVYGASLGAHGTDEVSCDVYDSLSSNSSHDALKDQTLHNKVQHNKVLHSQTLHNKVLHSQSQHDQTLSNQIPADQFSSDHTPSDQTRDFSGYDVPRRSSSLSKWALASQSTQPKRQVILGCDSLFVMNGEIVGKPHSPQVARQRLASMSGATGQLWTGHCLIDMQTGEIVRFASHATLHFARFSDDEIEAYIATGEPLEVAGCFTLEGLGGAFIDRIEGDHHGIIGLSIPLVREQCHALGYRWIDFWDTPTTEASGNPQSTDHDGEQSSKAYSKLAPAHNVNQPGDGWVNCDCGRRHWGLNGAAGVLLARAHEGVLTHIVLQHRASWSAEGSTWGIPGGAIADGESPVEGALRETYEEASIHPADIDVLGAYCEDHAAWSYTTVFALERSEGLVSPQVNDDESKQVAWVPVDEVEHHPLLTALRVDWPLFRAQLEKLIAQEHRKHAAR